MGRLCVRPDAEGETQCGRLTRAGLRHCHRRAQIRGDERFCAALLVGREVGRVIAGKAQPYPRLIALRQPVQQDEVFTLLCRHAELPIRAVALHIARRGEHRAKAELKLRAPRPAKLHLCKLSKLAVDGRKRHGALRAVLFKAPRGVILAQRPCVFSAGRQQPFSVKSETQRVLRAHAVVYAAAAQECGAAPIVCDADAVGPV